MKQAQSASRAAESLMDAGDSKKASEKEKELEKKVKSAEEGKHMVLCSLVVFRELHIIFTIYTYAGINTNFVQQFKLISLC